mmetsp:Transcript_36701/g.92306  ORF Transcript_36701/g.92306 Transcript_36701/m.92306 type:complete len:98 (+) Transcript_36701:395-688(+)
MSRFLQFLFLPIIFFFIFPFLVIIIFPFLVIFILIFILITVILFLFVLLVFCVQPTRDPRLQYHLLLGRQRMPPGSILCWKQHVRAMPGRFFQDAGD